MEDDAIDQIMQLTEVKGVLQTNVVGDDISSNIVDEQLSHFIKYLVGFTPLFEKTAELGQSTALFYAIAKTTILEFLWEKRQSRCAF